MIHSRNYKKLFAIFILILVAFVTYKPLKKRYVTYINRPMYLENSAYNTKLDESKFFDEITIIVPSCDKYSELWEPHFHFLFKYWPNLKTNNIPIILVSNKLSFEHERVQNFKTIEDISWSDNLILALNQVKTKYVIILLEDYLLNAPVNEVRLKEIMLAMENNKAVYSELAIDELMFELNAEQHYNYVPNLEGLIKRSYDGTYRTSLQSCIWRIDALKKILNTKESAWEFEIEGTNRSRKILNDFYMVVSDPVFNYYNAAYLGTFQPESVDYIRQNHLKFEPKKLPIDTINRYPRKTAIK